jgi:hypothetical protein
MTYEIVDPFEGAPDDVEVGRWLEQQGWSEFLGIGGEESDLSIRSYRRSVEGRDEFIVQVWDVNQGSPFVRVDSFGVLMDLLARWAPAVHTAEVVGLVTDLRSFSLSDSGVAEVIAAKAAFGAGDGLRALREHERERAAEWRRRREKRAAVAGVDGSGPS